MSNKYQIVNKLIPRTTVDFYRQLKKLFNDKNPMTHELVDAILSVFLLLPLRHCIEGMLITMMMNCPVADVALMILPGGRETSHHQDSWHIRPIEGCLLYR